MLFRSAGTVQAPQSFPYMLASVSSIAPNLGSASGGSLITITGAYLALTTGVTVGGVPATNVTVVNANTVTAVTPSGSPISRGASRSSRGRRMAGVSR